MNYQLDFHGETLMQQYHERIPVYERLAHLADILCPSCPTYGCFRTWAWKHSAK